MDEWGSECNRDVTPLDYGPTPGREPAHQSNSEVLPLSPIFLDHKWTETGLVTIKL